MLLSKDTKLTVSLVLNDASFTKRLNQVNKDLKLNKSEFENAAAGNDKFEKSLQGVQSKLQNVSAKFEIQGKKVELYKGEIDKTKTTLEELTKSYHEQSSKLESLNKRYEETCSTLGETSPEAKALKEEIKGLEKSHTSLENKIVTTNSRLTSLKTGLNEAETEFKELDNEVGKASRQMANFKTDKLRQDLTEMSEKLKTSGDKLKNVGKGFNEVGNVVGKAAIPILGVGTAAAVTSINFEAAMSNVKAISRASGKDFEDLTAKAREMGAKTSKTAKESADALSYMALAGWDVNQMLTGLEPILRLSEAGAMDLATASDLVTDSMGPLKLNVDQLGEYLDKVSQTSRTSNTNIQQLMEAFINCGSTTSNLGMSVEEASAALGILANNGTKGYEAGTKLNSILTRMTAQSKPAIKAWNNIGVSVYDSEGKFRGLGTILTETKEKFAKLTKEQQQYFLKGVAGTDNITDFMNLMNSSNGELEELTKNIKDSDGALMDMATTMQDNVKGEFTKLKSNLEELGIKLGESILPIISDVIDKVSGLVDKFNELSPEMQELIVKSSLFTVGAYGVSKGLGTILDTGGTLLKVGGKIVGSFGKSAKAADDLGDAVTKAAGTAGKLSGVKGLAVALGNGAATMAPWVLGAAAVAGTGYGIYKAMTAEAVPAVDLFADKLEVTQSKYDEYGESFEYNTQKISEGTKQAVQSYLDLDENASSSIFSLYSNSSKSAELIKIDMINKFGETSDLCTDISAEMKSKLYSEFSQIYSNTSGFSEQTKNDMVGKMKEMLDSTSMISQAQKDKILADYAATYENSGIVTETWKNEMISKYNTMGETIKTSLKAHQDQEMLDLQNYFFNSNALTTEEEAVITSKINAEWKMRQDTINGYTYQINGILTTAYNEHRTLKEDEVAKINELQNQMKADAVTTLSETETESKIILERMKAYNGRITAEQASQEIQKANEVRDKTIKAANEEYDGTLAWIIKQRDEMGTITEEQAEKMIEEATKQKEETIEKADEMKEGVIEKIKEMNKDTVDGVDTATGKIKSAWNSVVNWWNGLSFNKKRLEADLVENRTTNYKTTNDGNFRAAYLPEEYASTFAMRSPYPISDSIEVPNATSYAAQTVESISSVRKKDSSGVPEMMTVMEQSLKETQQQNALLLELISLMKNTPIPEIVVDVDGRALAKASAKYMKNEIDSIELKRRRLGGAF